MSVADFACAWCERVKRSGAPWQSTWPEEMRLSSTTLGMCPECLAAASGDALDRGVVLSLAVFEGH